MSGFLENVIDSEQHLRALFAPTPLQRNAYLSQKYGADIWLKREDLTPVRSYKLRGAYNFVRHALSRVDENAVFVCASAGNHAQGLAYSCHYFGRLAVIFMPVTTPQQKIDKTRAFGRDNVEIRLIGDTFDECYKAAQDYVASSGAIMAPPFDHEDIIIGQATIGLEIERQLGEATIPSKIIVPVGGGGLASGLARFIEARHWQTDLRFVEPEGAPSLKTSLQQGERIKLAQMDSFVDGAAVAQIGARNFDILKQFSADQVGLIAENRLCATMIEMLNVEGVVLEPAGAMSIDALKDFKREDIAGKTIICVVSGGNFDFERLPDVKERALRYDGLKKYFLFRFPQRPGALRSFLDHLGPEDDVARFEYLKKSARNFGSVLIGIETKRPENFDILKQKFDAAGWAWQDITDDKVLFDFVI